MKKLNLAVPVEKSRLFLGLTAALMVVSVLAMFILGFAMPYGTEGGYILQMELGDQYNESEIRTLLQTAGIETYQLRAANNGTQAVIFSEEMTAVSAAEIWESAKQNYGLDDAALITNDIVSTGVDGTTNRRVVTGTILFAVAFVVLMVLRFHYQAALAGLATLVCSGVLFWGLVAGARVAMTDQIYGGFALSLALGLVYSYYICRTLQGNLGRGNDTLEAAVDRATAKAVNVPVMLSAMVVMFALPLLFVGGSVYNGFYLSLVLAALSAAYAAACVTGPFFYLLKKRSGNTALRPLWKR